MNKITFYRSGSSPSIFWCDLWFFGWCYCCFRWNCCKRSIWLGWCFCLRRHWTKNRISENMTRNKPHEWMKMWWKTANEKSGNWILAYVGKMSADLPRISFGPINTSGNPSLVIVSIVWYSVVSIEYKLIAPSTRSS